MSLALSPSNALKLSISLEPQLAHFVQVYQRNHKKASRSQVISEALQLLQNSERERKLEWAYAQSSQEDAQINAEFDVAQTDGLTHETW